MALFKKFFAPADPLSSLRKSFSRGQWADVIALGKGIDPGSLAEEAGAELADLLRQAGDRLAALNLSEAEAFLRCGDELRAREHLVLAESLTEDAALRERVRELRASQAPPPRTAPEPAPAPAAAEPAHGCGGSCGPQGCGPQLEEEPAPTADADLDLDTRLELCLGGYPEGAVDRYLALGVALKQAVVLAHGGERDAALEAFAVVPEAERGEDFHYERGVLLAHSGEVEGAAGDLQRCLQLAPRHPLAGEVLFNLLLGAGRFEEAGVLLEELAAGGQDVGFCLARRAILAAVLGDFERSLADAEAAFEAGNREGELLLLFGQLLERNGRLDQAEKVYAMTGGGAGCGGGGMPVALAEFLLRQKRQLGRVVESFKGLWNQEPTNPLWMLRTGQAYLAMGSTEQGRKLVRAVLERPDAPEELREEARQGLDAD